MRCQIDGPFLCKKVERYYPDARAEFVVSMNRRSSETKQRPLAWLVMVFRRSLLLLLGRLAAGCLTPLQGRSFRVEATDASAARVSFRIFA
jgi:hypothetical protein